jgi:hypothetical protein
MPTEIKLNRISNHDRESIEFVRSRIKHIDSVLEQLHLEHKKRFTHAQLQAMDTVVAYTNAISNVLREKCDEIKERLETDSLEFRDGPTNHCVQSSLS